MQAPSAAVRELENHAKVRAQRPLVLFVAAELGSRWNDSPGGSPAADEQVSLVAQCPEESPIRILPRMIRQLSAVEASGKLVARAAILLNCRHDEEAMSTRRLVLLALSRHARAVGSSIQVTLCGDAAAGPDYRQKLSDLMSLARAEQEHDARGARVQLHFEERSAH